MGVEGEKKGGGIIRVGVGGVMGGGGGHLASLYIPYIDIYEHIPYNITTLYFCITVLPLQKQSTLKCNLGLSVY